ncbi:hypothetical protein VB774_12515 [Pseudanabaena galeata UHCC 0370]|uniref:Uncharacterized protein n=1 Tax=Pseudanabaena galeata UHCC 0370 TaxID=3110310 RepID=A0ABU5TKB7_9CYAN|nr:hypothetical protein [Pseudanabaena galeata]MEA5478443.1 hypothetical protein [Pseudanabaena galeata UHCC 0370]
MVATPDWLAIIDDEISLWLNPTVIDQIYLDTQDLANANEIIYRVNSRDLLKVLASSVGMAAKRQGAIAIWTYYTDKIGSLGNLSTTETDSPILRTLIHIDGDLSQKVCEDILYHPRADRILTTHSFVVGQISRQLLTAISDYVEQKLRPFAIATVSFTTTITWCDPLQNLGKRFSFSADLTAYLSNQCWAMASAAPIVVLMIWWIYSKLNLTLPSLPKSSQKFFTNLLGLLESQVFRLVAIAVVIILIFCWITIRVAIPIEARANSFIVTLESLVEPYLPVAIISLREWIVSGLGKIFFRYPFFVKLIFGRFVR